MAIAPKTLSRIRNPLFLDGVENKEELFETLAKIAPTVEMSEEAEALMNALIVTGRNQARQLKGQLPQAGIDAHLDRAEAAAPSPVTRDAAGRVEPRNIDALAEQKQAFAQIKEILAYDKEREERMLALSREQTREFKDLLIFAQEFRERRDLGPGSPLPGELVLPIEGDELEDIKLPESSREFGATVLGGTEDDLLEDDLVTEDFDPPEPQHDPDTPAELLRHV